MPKYTKDVLEPLVKHNFSVAGVMRDLGFENLNGGSHRYIADKIRQLGISTDHFLGRASNRGCTHKGGSVRKPAMDILTLRNKGIKQHTYKLRRALLEIGVPYICVDCGNNGVWNEKPIVLQIDHVNGQTNDDRPENLKFRCPNCHSQTRNWGTKNFPERGPSVVEAF